MRNHFIFLDFDGVLNTGSYQKELKKKGLKTSDNYGPLFDPKCVNVLAKLLERVPGSKIVIISSWSFEGLDRMRRLWKDRGLPSEVYAIANSISWGLDAFDISEEDPDLDNMVGKGQSVRTFLKGRKDYGYLILDDVQDFFPDQMPHYVAVDDEIGLCAEQLDHYVEILTK